jgi:hypothetical protein
MTDRSPADRFLEVARELRAAAVETRRTLQVSHDLIRRAREQTAAGSWASDGGDDSGPSERLVTSLIDAYEAAESDNDTQTRQLLARVLHHVGRRVAGVMGPRAARISVH